MSEGVEKKALVPKLRFPEFRKMPFKSGDAGIHFKVVNDREHNSDLPVLAITQDQGAIPRDLIDYNVSVTDASLATYKVVRDGDFIISLRSFQGGIERSRYTGLCSPAYIVLRADEKVDAEFFRYYFKTKEYISQLNLEIEGIRDGKMISYSQFARIPIPMPLLGEQRKIAECLQSLDELIAAETEKLEALKRHKKGLLQQLFPAEGETTPRLRFPSYSAPWQRLALGKLLSESPRYGLNAPSVGYRADLPLYLRITDIDEDGRYIREGRVSVASPVSDADYLHEGDIAVARTGASVGKSYFCEGYDGPFVYAGFLIRLRANPKCLLPALLAQWLRTSEYWDWVTLTCARSGQPGINGTEYASASVPVPSGPTGMQEQQKIAACLAAEDTMINVVRYRIESLRVHKSGLMQQLFPVLEEGQT